MKKRIVAVFVAAVIAASLFAVPSSASQIVFFTAVDDTLMPLRDLTMPAYFGSKLYAHMSAFQSAGITFGLSGSKNNLFAYSGKRRLNFFISLGEATDQDGVIYESAAVERINGQYFLPVDFLCEYFKLSYAVLPNDPVSVLRIKTESAVFNDVTFVGYYKSEMQKQYDTYMNSSVPPSAPPAGDVPPTTYSDITVYLSFYATSAGFTEKILDELEAQDVTAIFFMTAGEIVRSPELARRISGEGHTLGIWLETADADEFRHAQSLLFEAAFTFATLVSSPSDTRTAVKELASDLDVIYLAPTSTVTDTATAESVVRNIPTKSNARTELRFACSENTSENLPYILTFLRDREYNVRPVNETHHI
ncbi:MAG: polysaccharide deacetylase family protein [Oscillospiraceae bacterium]|nr:polysaccharide deacetylase family protein [Oscillospiraceae bacterium]